MQLIRKDDKDVMFHTQVAAAEKIVLSKIAWSVPIVQPRVLPRIMSFPYRFGRVNVKRFLYLQHDPLYDD